MNKKTFIRILAGVFGVTGLSLLMAIMIPIAVNESRARQEYPDLLSPVPGGGNYGLSTSLLSKSADIPQLLAAEDENGIDYTKASTWFPQSADGRHFASHDSISFYTLTIPALGIESAAVAVGGEDLSANIIQYPGTALPGKLGNSVLFGHSILPYFFDPKDYLSIFSTIDKLEKGDEIYVDYDGISYTYRVKEMFRVKPEDVYILNQNEDDSYMSLVTCFPMGHPAKPERLVVRTELVPHKN